MTAYISPILTLVASLVGLGVTYGILKTVVETLRAEVDRLRVTTDRHAELFSSLREEVRVNFALQAGGKIHHGGKPQTEAKARKVRRSR